MSQDQPAPGLADAPVASAHTGFPIVGLGASAGGLAAFEAFFTGLPNDTDGFGKLTAGVKSWIHIGGFQFQPAEFMKLTMVLMLAANCSSVPLHGS